MITIDKGMTNSCVFTLTEKRTLSSTASNVFLQFYNNQDNYNKLMYLNNDLSPNTERYNLFLIEETINEDLNNQKIELNLTTYDYFIHEIPIGATLSLDNSIKILETGLITVNGTSSIVPTYTKNDDNRTYTFE